MVHQKYELSIAVVRGHCCRIVDKSSFIYHLMLNHIMYCIPGLSDLWWETCLEWGISSGVPGQCGSHSQWGETEGIVNILHRGHWWRRLQPMSSIITGANLVDSNPYDFARQGRRRSIMELTSSLVWAYVILADFQRVISPYLQYISTYHSYTAQRVLRTISMQKSELKYACLSSKIFKVWIDRFCVRCDWWRRLQPTSSVSPVCIQDPEIKCRAHESIQRPIRQLFINYTVKQVTHFPTMTLSRCLSNIHWKLHLFMVWYKIMKS